MCQPFKQSAPGNRAWGGAQRSFEVRSQARDDSGSRGSSAPLHAAGDGEVTGSQDDTVYVSVWFMASNDVCDPFKSMAVPCSTLGGRGTAPSCPVPLGEVPRVFKGEGSRDCRVWLVLDMAQNF